MDLRSNRNPAALAQSKRPSAWKFAVLAAPVLLAVGLLVCPGLDHSTAAYRDAGHFYFPLSTWVAEQQKAGHLPLWNPYENVGIPLAGEGTSALFYPGKVLFLLPISPARAYNLYLISHLLLASGTTYRLARRWSRTRPAALLAAVSYAWGGSVLSQHANLVYLVSAAWLPLTLELEERLLRTPRLRHALGLAAAWAMMVLGGDPQTAYHSGLILLLAAVLLLWSKWSRAKATSKETRQRLAGLWQWSAPRLGAGVLAVVALVVLSAVQWLPTAELARRSTRLTETTRSLGSVIGGYAEAEELSTAEYFYERLLAPPPQNSHTRATFEFSTGPWRATELLWPNVGGRLYPEHRRWMQIIPAETRLWVPSVYFGVLPLLLAITAMCVRRGQFRRKWLTWTVGLSLVASLGIFAPGWAARELFANWDPAAREFDNWIVSDAVGGLYWLMTILLPGYSGFRYPGKWLVVANLALSLLAAYGLDGIARGGRPAQLRRIRCFRRMCSTLAATSLVLLALGWLFQAKLFTLWETTKDDVLFGPLDVNGAWADLMLGLTQTAVLCLITVICLRLERRKLAAVALVTISILDLVWANSWVVGTAPSELWRQPQAVAEAIRQDAERRRLFGPLRVYRPRSWFPALWKETRSPERFAQIVAWDHQTLYPKHHLYAELGLVDVPGTMSLAAYRTFATQTRTRTFDDAELLHQLDTLGVQYILWPSDWVLPHGAGWKRMDVEFAESEFDSGLQQEVSLWYNPRAVSPIRAECDAAGDVPSWFGVFTFEPNLVVVHVELPSAGRLVWTNANYPGWKASLEKDDGAFQPVETENGEELAIAVRLPAGRHFVRLEYQPPVVTQGMLLSLAGWVSLLGYWLSRVWLGRAACSRSRA